MINYLCNDILTHPAIYSFLLIVGYLTCQHVFFACVATRKKHKALLEESKEDRKEMQKILDGLRDSQVKCPLLK